MGGYERDPAPFGLDGIPQGFEAQLLTEDWDRFEELMQGAVRRVPAMEDAEVKHFFNGPEAFTPDGEFILGESEVPGFWVAAGFCAHGLAGAGGIGKVMAEWIVDGEPECDLWHMDIRRFGRQYRSQSFALARTTEVYSHYYDIKYPGEERRGRTSAARLARRTRGTLKIGASFGEKSGWERVNWFDPNAADGDESLRPRGWAGQHWSPAIEVECLATRERAVLIDESSFAEDRRARPRRVRLPRPHVRERRRPAARLRHLHPAAQRPRRHRERRHARAPRERPLPLVTGTAFGSHNLAWLRRHLPEDGSVYVDDVTASRACFGLWGPRARDILQSLTKSDLSTRGLPVPAGAGDRGRLRAAARLRVTYVGELGCELYCPTEYGLALCDCSGRGRRAARPAWRRLPGDRVAAAREGLPRVGHRHHARDDAGVGRARASRCGSTSPRRSSVARRCVAEQRGRRAGASAFVCIVLDDPRSVCLGGEPVRIAGAIAGRVTSGGYGHRIERSIAYAYLPSEASAVGTAVELDVFGDLISGSVAAEPLYDPDTRAHSQLGR